MTPQRGVATPLGRYALTLERDGLWVVLTPQGQALPDRAGHLEAARQAATDHALARTEVVPDHPVTRR